MEKLLFTGTRELFKINDERIKYLYSNGLIRKGRDDYVEFWVPLYRKAVYDAFYPYNNGEADEQLREINLGRSDLIINIAGKETVIEFKIYRDQARFEKGKQQVAHYAKSISVDECVYLVFISNVYRELGMKDEVLTIDGVIVRCYVIFYDQTKDF